MEVGACPNLPDLPPALVISICQLLVQQRSGSPRDVVSLALSCKPLHDTITGTDDIWLDHCRRLGWRLAGLPSHPSHQPWAYFSRRMLVRWALRRQLRRVSLFLDPLSRSCLRPGVTPAALERAETALHLALPWELWELLRAHDGQENRPGVHFVNGARLLSLEELLCQAAGEPSAQLAEAYAAWKAAGGRAEENLSLRSSRGGSSSGGGGGDCSSTGSGGHSEAPPMGGPTVAAAPGSKQAPCALLPWTDVLRGGAAVCCGP